MPSRRTAKPPPSFSFVTSEFEPNGVNWLKVHSGAARRHAAYWGGPVRQQGKTQNAGRQESTIVSASDGEGEDSSRNGSQSAFGCFAARNIQRRGSSKTKNAKVIISPPQEQPQSPRHIEFDIIRHLPSTPSEIRAIRSPSEAVLSAFEFLGDCFVKQFVLYDHEDFQIMFSGCLLVSYAYTMSLTGQGTETTLLELKSQVIRRISTKMRSSDGQLSPQGLVAVLALGAPIVCLVSQDLPKSLSISEYINVSAREDYLCCTESSDTAQCALRERMIHRQAMGRLFSKIDVSVEDTGNLALLQYVLNSMNMSIAIEAAEHLYTPLESVGDLFPATNPPGNNSIPPHWCSPITSQWFRCTSASYIETQMISLSELTHRWFATFFDKASGEVLSKNTTAEERVHLREKIERFSPIAGTSNIEAEAMYESCRWASLVMLSVEKMSIPIHIAAKHVRIQPRLIKRLRSTDLLNLWGNRKGLLFWVTTLCHFATAGQCFPLLSTTLFARFASQMAMLECCSEIAINPLRRLKLFESLCCSGRSA